MRSRVLWALSLGVSAFIVAGSLFFMWLAQAGPIRPQAELIRYWPEGVYYEVFVPAFYDSDGDGVGDLRGVTAKLDDLATLGVEGLYLMPIYPSPSYHGYDVTDYTSIRPEYGTVGDLKALVEAAHARGMHVILDFVANHTSREHPWFRAALDGDPFYRDFYVWANDETNLGERGTWNQPLWYPVPGGQEYYFATFDAGMPDLNYDNPEVRKRIIEAAVFWLKEADVDGFRLDAAQHLYSRSRMNDTVAWWRSFHQALAAVKPDVFLVGEVWESPGVIAPFLDGALDAAFDFALADRLLSVVREEDEQGLISFLVRVREAYARVNPRFVDGIFLSNHDTPRAMTALDENVDHAKMAASLLFTLPGAPFVYYGEEIGMLGPKPDPRIREPIRWGKEEDAHSPTVFPRMANRDQPTYAEIMEDPQGLYRHYRTMIYLRRSLAPLGTGDIQPSRLKEKGLVAFWRTTPDERLLVLHNISRMPLDVRLSPEGERFRLVYSTHVDNRLNGSDMHLAPYSTAIVRP